MKGAAPLPLGEGLGFGEGAHLGRRPPPLAAAPLPLAPIYSGGLGGGAHSQGAAPLLSPQPSLPPTLPPLRLRVTPTLGVARVVGVAQYARRRAAGVSGQRRSSSANLDWIEDGRRHRCRTCTSTRGRRTFGRRVSFVELRDLEVGAAVQLHQPRSKR